jgi:indolepyruvate decarboxylase
MVIAGDGGFMMMCQALSTISRNKLNPVVFVMSNGVYAIEQSFVNICAFTPHGEFAPFDVLPSWDYLSLAKAYGMLGHKVKTGEDLLKTLDHIKQNPHEPILVEVVIDKHALAPAMAGLVESITHKTVDQCQAKDH